MSPTDSSNTRKTLQSNRPEAKLIANKVSIKVKRLHLSDRLDSQHGEKQPEVDVKNHPINLRHAYLAK